MYIEMFPLCNISLMLALLGLLYFALLLSKHVMKLKVFVVLVAIIVVVIYR